MATTRDGLIAIMGEATLIPLPSCAVGRGISGPKWVSVVGPWWGPCVWRCGHASDLLGAGRPHATLDALGVGQVGTTDDAHGVGHAKFGATLHGHAVGGRQGANHATGVLVAVGLCCALGDEPHGVQVARSRQLDPIQNAVLLVHPDFGDRVLALGRGLP